MDKKYLKPFNSKSVSQKIIDELTAAMVRGDLKPGDKIPTEMELAQQYDVSRNSVREAVKILVSYGVLEIKRAEGTYVCSGFSRPMLNPLMYGIILSAQESYGQLVELRTVIDSGVMRILADGRGSSYKEYLRRRYMDLEYALDHSPHDYEAILKEDMLFHLSLAEATENQLLIQMEDLILELCRSSSLRNIKVLMERDEKEGATFFKDSHRELMNVVVQGDKERVDTSLENAYYYWKHIYLET